MPRPVRNLSAGFQVQPRGRVSRFRRFRVFLLEVLEVRLALAGDLENPSSSRMPGVFWDDIASMEASQLTWTGNSQPMNSPAKKPGGDLPTGNFQFGDGDRWSSTATNGSGLQQGDPTTLRWSIVRDGVAIPGSIGEPAASSNLVTTLGIIYGNTTPLDTNFSDEPWFGVFQSYLNRWADLSGLSYVYEPNDDGASFPGSAGAIGARGDIRIAGHTIDGNSGVLAYNFFPNTGDMVIDTADNFYNNLTNNSRGLRNVLAHENGHGIGIAHVCPVVSGINGRLMEPFVNLAFDGPQFDDILAAQRGYGDVLEKAGGNNSSGTATNLGTLNNAQTISRGVHANDNQVVPAETDFISIDDDSDLDFFRFTVGSGISANIVLTPVGPTYLSGPQNQDGSCSPGTAFNASAQSDLTLQFIAADGTTVVQSVNANGLSGAESITTSPLNAGTYFVRVSGSADAAQMYQLSLTGTQATGVFVLPSGGSTQVREGGFTDTYTLQLATAPAGPVEISITAGGQVQVSSDGTNFSNSLSLTIADSNVRTITVQASDDTVIDGTQTTSITHAITATSDPATYPTSLTISSVSVEALDNELPALVRQPTLGSLLGTSLGNTGSLAGPTDVLTFGVTLEAGQLVSATVSPDVSSSTVSIQLVGVTGVIAAPAPGSPAVLPASVIPSSGSYTLRVTGTSASNVVLDFYLNALAEAVDSTGVSPLAMDSSQLALGDGRYEVVGGSTGFSSTLQFNPKVNNASLFVDIATTGTPLGLGDDDVAVINTTVGNLALPAGPVTVSNNGVVVSGATGVVTYSNGSLPSGAFGRAIVPFWDDLFSSSGNVFWQQLTIGGINALVIQWNNRPHYDFTSGAVTFQIQVFQSGPVLVRYAYRDVGFGTAGLDGGVSATVGYQASSTSAVTFSFNTASLVNNDVLDLIQPLSQDEDFYSLNLNGHAGRSLDVVLSGIGSDYGGQSLQLIAPDGTTVLATGSTEPLQSGVNPANQDLSVLGFVIPSNGIYRLRVAGGILGGRYSLTATSNLVMDTEPNNASSNALRSIQPGKPALGWLSVSDADDFYQINLNAGEILQLRTRTLFDSSSSPLTNSLDPELQVLHPDGTTVVANDTNTLDGKNARATFRAPVAGTYRARIRATSGAGEYLLTANLLPPVQITELYGNSSAWEPIFRDFVDGGFNDNLARGYLIPPNSTRPMPWRNLNQIRIGFTANVGASLGPADFALLGQDGLDAQFQPGFVPAITGVTFDAASSIATLQLSGFMGPNIFYLNVLADGIFDSQGAPLDANRQLRFFVLPGDVDGVRTGLVHSVNSGDLTRGYSAVGGLIYDEPNATQFDGAYFGYVAEADLNGNGTILSDDITGLNNSVSSLVAEFTLPPPLAIQNIEQPKGSVLSSSRSPWIDSSRSKSDSFVSVLGNSMQALPAVLATGRSVSQTRTPGALPARSVDRLFQELGSESKLHPSVDLFGVDHKSVRTGR